MRNIYIFLSALFIIIGALIIDRIWFGFFSYQTFFKLLWTIIIMGVVVSAIFLLRKHYKEETTHKKDKYLD